MSTKYIIPKRFRPKKQVVIAPFPLLKVSNKHGQMSIPVDSGSQVSLYVDCLNDRGREDDVDVIRLKWDSAATILRVYSHRMDEAWDKACSRLKYGEERTYRWEAGKHDSSKDKLLRVGESLEIAFWTITLSKDAIDITGINTVEAWIPPEEFSVQFAEKTPRILKLDAPAPTRCDDFKRCPPIDLWNRWDGLWINATIESKEPTACLLWAPMLAEDGIAQTFSIEYPDYAFLLDNKIPYSIRWEREDEKECDYENDDDSFTSMKGWPNTVFADVGESQHVVDSSAKTLAPIPTPKYKFALRPIFTVTNDGKEIINAASIDAVNDP